MSPLQLAALCEEAARVAGAILREKFDETRSVQHKGAGRNDLVTDADTASERAILKVLHQRVPGHAVLAEESGASGTSDYLWFVDPLDGTTNYAHHVPHFCVTLAVEGPCPEPVEGRALLAGVVYDPLRDELFLAARGHGATLNGRRIATSQVAALEDALLSTGFPYDLGARPDVPLGLFTRLVRQGQGMRRMGSAAMDLAAVACGRFDGYWEFSLKPWDTVAGALLVQEAGGVVTRVDGEPWAPCWGDVLASGAPLAPRLSAETKAFLSGSSWQPRAFPISRA